jgi:uncharacterized protein (UPF0261 family)
MSGPAILLIGFLDTKAAEHAFVRDKLLSAGNDVILVDVSVHVSVVM